MVWFSLHILVIFLEIFDTVYCENDTFSSFSPKELKNVNLLKDKGIPFDHSRASSEPKVVEKRRLLFKEGDLNSQGKSDREFEINDPSSRKTANITETQITEYQRGYNNWGNKQNTFSFPIESGNSRNSPEFRNSEEFRLRQPLVGLSNHNFNWGQRSGIIDTRQSEWNEEKNFNQLANPDTYSRMGNNFSGRVPQVLSRGDMDGNIYEGKNGDILNRKISMTTLNDRGMLKEKNYYDERLREMNSGFLGTSNMNYYNRNSKGFSDANLHRPEKGVIINFNTECPAPRQFSNHMVHKFIFTPKSSTSIQPDILPFQVPDTALISGQQMTPMYYL